MDESDWAAVDPAGYWQSKYEETKARLAEAERERDDQIKWASHYAARAGRLEDELRHLHQAYANKHSPQHRAAALNSAEGVLRATDSASGGEA